MSEDDGTRARPITAKSLKPIVQLLLIAILAASAPVALAQDAPKNPTTYAGSADLGSALARY